MRYFLYIIICLFFLQISSCRKIHYYADKSIKIVPTINLAHRGGGSLNFRENTLESAINAFNVVDGIETDVQISKNNTIWLSHNTKVVDCAGEQDCFFSTKDDFIRTIDSCNGKSIKYNQLAEIMAYMNTNNIKKYVSIDLKEWTPCGIGGLDIEGTMRWETEKIIDLAKLYNIEEYILFESQIASVLNWVQKKSTKAQTYYTSYGDLERGMLVALENNFTGVSLKGFFKDSITKDYVELYHKKGLKLNVWNIDNEAHASELRSLNVDFIQIDL